MKLTIRLFATLKDRAGKPQIEVDLPDSSTVEQLLTAVAADYPQLAPALPTVLVAVNKAFASPHTPIQTGDEVALFPPVSGGNFPYPTYFALSEAEPDIRAIHAHLTQPDVGAIVTFTGSVRGQTERDGLPPATIHLEYEAYSEMAELKMAQIAQEIWERWPQVKGIAIVQRIGKLGVGDLTTFVACASGHRDQGVFDAARYGIDRLKEIVPVWKKEVGPDKSVWVEGHYQATEKDN
ncbi:MAG: molybdopterin converting factor subunit 1 [Ardenticatenaceae bacterium]|nr:molybdopterin converting factor subunit 1 [Ardenticatenaceae bacterium]